MKYYLKDKNGTVHTESQNSFKMAFKHHHIIDKTTDEGGIAGYFNISYPNEGHNEHLGIWSFGIPAINDVYETNASTYWRTRATNNFITPIDLVVNDNDLIHKSNIKNKIIIKYDTKTNEIPTGWELYTQTSEEHSRNGILTLKNIYDNNNNSYCVGYLINMNEQSSSSHWTWGYAENYQVNTKAAHTVYNKNNKYYQEHTFSNSEKYKTNYFTIKKSDWNNYTKIRIRVRLVFNNFYNSSDPEHALGKIKNAPSGGVSEYLRPVILVARTSNNTELSDTQDFGLKSDGTREYHGLSFLYGDNKKDTFCSLDDATETRENRGRLNPYKDFMTYEHLSEENYYYTYTYTPYTTLGGTPTRIYEISKDDVYNYLNMDNPPFRIMTFDDYNNTDLQTDIHRGIDIKDLNTYLAPKLGNDWYKKTLDKSTNITYPIKIKEGWWYEYKNTSNIMITKYSYSDTNSFYADGYYDINVSELKDYLHICFPYITTCGGSGYTYSLYSFLEMSVEGVN